jgi:hypothetical protein
LIPQGKDLATKQFNFEDTEADYMMIDPAAAASHKHSPTTTQTSSGKKTKRDQNETGNNYKERPWHYRFWYGYPVMEE